MKRVIYLGGMEGFEATQEALQGYAEVVNVDANSGDVAREIVTAAALLDASMRVRITDAMVAAAPELEIISCATTGSDHIERGSLNDRGIPVRTLKEDPELLRNITPAAELSWLLLMACARKLPPALAHVVGGNWQREQFPGMMLNGRRLGLIGCGRIGGWMSRYAKAFGMDVVGFDPMLAAFPETIRSVSLNEVLETSDFVSIHVHLTPETSGMMTQENFARMKRGAIFINTSRGALTDEAALLEALESGQLAAAGLDVLNGEPDVADHPLVAYARTHENLLITPHCGGFSPDAVRKVCTHAAGKILRQLTEG